MEYVEQQEGWEEPEKMRIKLHLTRLARLIVASYSLAMVLLGLVEFCTRGCAI
jgi:hypothetical protein